MTHKLAEGAQPVRLSEDEKKAILGAVQSALTSTDWRWDLIALFGSRVDLTSRGGDIDLYVRVQGGAQETLPQVKRNLITLLWDALGEQKIDLVFDDLSGSLGAFKQVIEKEMVVLWRKT